MKKYLLILILLITLISCKTKGLEDGIYKGKSKTDIDLSHGEVTLVIKYGKFRNVEFVSVLPDGSIKDENYGKNLDSDSYNKIQKQLKAMQKFAQGVIKHQRLNSIDYDSYNESVQYYYQFIDAAYDAFYKAQKKRKFLW